MKQTEPTLLQGLAAAMLPYAEHWKPGQPVCTGEDFTALLQEMGHNATMPGGADLVYFLAGSANDPEERAARFEAIRQHRYKWEDGSKADMAAAIEASHREEMQIPTAAKRAAAVDELAMMAPQEESPPEPVEAQAIGHIKSKEVDWLVQGLLPRGDISILGADGGTGKGLWTAQLVAYVTTGNECPFFPQPLTSLGTVLIFSGEDDPERVLRPRLAAAGADLSKVFFVTSDGHFSKYGTLLNIAGEQMKEYLDSARPALVVVDPYQAFIAADIKMAERNQMRGATTPFRAYLKAAGAAGLLVAHSNKKGAVSGRQRLADSSDLWDMARCVFMMGRARKEKAVYISNEKNSYAAEAQTVLFHIEGTTAEGVTTAKAVFQSYTQRKDYDFIFEKVSRPAATKEAAKAAILAALEDSKLGSMESNKLKENVMSQTCCSKDTYYNAYNELKTAGNIEYRQISTNGVRKGFVFPRARDCSDTEPEMI